MPSPKSLLTIQRQSHGHWVGDGFPVKTLFAYPEFGTSLSPFLLLDYAAPREFPPTSDRLGVGEHPHRGFETVTIVYSGEVEHRDSGGGGGKIGPGDVQWMTAASGLVHEEFHGREFARRGGVFEVVQLWVNLPAKYKMAPPAYQTLLSNQIPTVPLPQGRLRVIAGSYGGATGPAHTFTPMEVWDLRLTGNDFLELPLQEGHSAALVVLSGSVKVNGATALLTGEVGVFDHTGDTLHLEGGSGSTLLVLSGEPIQEPISGGGPFVMNTPQEIRQAYEDYQSGRMGRLGV